MKKSNFVLQNNLTSFKGAEACDQIRKFETYEMYTTLQLGGAKTEVYYQN